MKDVEEVDGHRHTYHSGGKKDREGKRRQQEEEAVQREIERQKAARLIVRILRKLGHEWMRVPLILPGWRDSL